MNEAKNEARRYIKNELGKDVDVKVNSCTLDEIKDITVYEVKGIAKIQKDPMHKDEKDFLVQIKNETGEVVGQEIMKR